MTAERVSPVVLRVRGKLAELARVQAEELGGLGSCVWSMETTDLWQPGCRGADRLFQFAEGGPADNHFGFCPYCGRRLEEVIQTAEGSER